MSLDSPRGVVVENAVIYRVQGKKFGILPLVETVGEYNIYTGLSTKIRP